MRSRRDPKSEVDADDRRTEIMCTTAGGPPSAHVFAGMRLTREKTPATAFQQDLDALKSRGDPPPRSLGSETVAVAVCVANWPVCVWRLRWRLAVGGWQVAGWQVGGWRLALAFGDVRFAICDFALAIGDWRLAIGDWRLAVWPMAFGDLRFAIAICDWRLPIGVWRLAFALAIGDGDCDCDWRLRLRLADWRFGDWRLRFGDLAIG